MQYFFPRVLLICCSEVFQAATFSLPKQYREHMEGFRDSQKNIKLHLTAMEWKQTKGQYNHRDSNIFCRAPLLNRCLKNFYISLLRFV